MRASALVVGLSCASIICSTLCGCSWRKIFSAETPTLPNAVAVDRALHLCSLSEGDQPFHLILAISSPAGSASPADVSTRPGTSSSRFSPRLPDLHADPAKGQMQASIEIFWLNAITYRLEIRSASFRQTRIVNGNVIEEHNLGDYYPRWIEDFVQGLLNPIPESARLRRVAGELPIGPRSEACISTDKAQPGSTQMCFRNTEPRIAGITDTRRSLWFDDYQPFGAQQIARTLVDNLEPNLLIRGHILDLEPLPRSLYPLLKATRFTSPQEQVATSRLSSTAAAALLLPPSMANAFRSAAYSPRPMALQSLAQQSSPFLAEPAGTDTKPSENQASVEQTPIYIRTDRTGRVREAYRSPSDQFGVEKAALLRALSLQFRPLIVNGAARQMEALVYLPATESAESETLNAAPRPSRPARRWPSIAQSNPGFADSTRPSHARLAAPETQMQNPASASAPQTAGPAQSTTPALPTPDNENR